MVECTPFPFQALRNLHFYKVAVILILTEFFSNAAQVYQCILLVLGQLKFKKGPVKQMKTRGEMNRMETV